MKLEKESASIFYQNGYNLRSNSILVMKSIVHSDLLIPVTKPVIFKLKICSYSLLDKLMVVAFCLEHRNVILEKTELCVK